MKVEILKPDEIDFGKLSRLLNSAFMPDPNSFAGKRQLEMITPDRLEEKYKSAPNGSFCAVIQIEGSYVAANGILGFELFSEGKILPVWLSCDTAIDMNYRSRGLFSECLKALEDYVGLDSCYIGFPNNASLNGFQRSGWNKVTEYRLAAKPLLFNHWTSSARIQGHVESLQFRNQFSTFSKSERYIEWRYPTSDYRYVKIASTNESIVSGIVLEQFVFHNVTSTLILETPFNGKFEYINSLALANRYAKLMESRVLVKVQGKGLFFWIDLAMGFFPIPSRFNSRRIFLVAKNADDIDFSKWYGALGDWDAL